MKLVSSLVSATLALGLSACATDQPAPSGVASALPALLEQAGLERTSDVRVFSGDSLWEYINGDAEIYHSYRFVDVATAEYGAEGLELVADIYRFEDPLHAYGLYTAIRPDGIQELGLGLAGFGSESTVDVVIGSHLVRLTAFNVPDGATRTIRVAAAELTSRLPGPAIRPTAFSLFPAQHQEVSADRFYATSFLGQAFLTEFYAQTYSVDGREVTLFCCESDPDTKLVLWLAEHPPGASPIPEVPFFEAGSVLWIPESYNGAILAGKSGRFLAGVVGYDESLNGWLSHWLGVLVARDLPISDVESR